MNLPTQQLMWAFNRLLARHGPMSGPASATPPLTVAVNESMIHVEQALAMANRFTTEQQTQPTTAWRAARATNNRVKRRKKATVDDYRVLLFCARNSISTAQLAYVLRIAACEESLIQLLRAGHINLSQLFKLQHMNAAQRREQISTYQRIKNSKPPPQRLDSIVA